MTKEIFKFVLFFAIVLHIGCGGDEEVTNPPPTDTSVANFNNLVISERTIPFDSALSAVDLNTGTIVLDGSSIKDANLVDSIAFNDSAFYFRSGDLSDIPVPGYQTKFAKILLYSNLTQDQFDTVKTMPDSDSLLTPDDFTLDITESFRTPQLVKPVYGFYLSGKYDLHVTPYRVFGLLYVDSTWVEPSGFKLRFDVKINKAGNNSFKSQ
ncbi:MAG TPA: hypothetical protein VGK25_12305 [Ignavibacteria bacterium]|jgi:hypothetical protein